MDAERTGELLQLNGQPRKAVPLFEQDIAICEKARRQKNLGN